MDRSNTSDVCVLLNRICLKQLLLACQFKDRVIKFQINAHLIIGPLSDERPLGWCPVVFSPH